MAEVTLSRVRKTYPNGHEAVKGFDLSIKDGEFVVLVGPSGCGKSTTLRMVAGLEDVTDGTIQIGERVVNAVHPKDRDIAMVFQNYALYPHMSVYKNMAFALKLRGVARPEIDRRVHDAARMLGIEELLDRKPKQLSGGQRQRVAVGRAIVREPRAFLFDEPLSNLDAKLRVTTRAELKSLHQRLKTTTIYVTHDQEEAMTLGDRIVVMAGGVIQQADAPLEVYRHPVNRFVAGFVGTPPMNFIQGTLRREGDRLRFIEDGQAGFAPLLSVHIPDHFRERLAPFADGPLVMGVRPQQLHESDKPDAFRLRVHVVEPLGDAMDVQGQTSGGRTLVARVSSNSHLKPGDVAPFDADTNRCHFFEPGEFGRNLTLLHHPATP